MVVPSSPHPPSKRSMAIALILALSTLLPSDAMASTDDAMGADFSSSGGFSRESCRDTPSSSSLSRNDPYYSTPSSEIELLRGTSPGTATCRDICCCCCWCCRCSHTPQPHTPVISGVSVAAPGAATNTWMRLFLALVGVVIVMVKVFTVTCEYKPGALKLQVAVKFPAVSIQLLEFGLNPRPYLKLLNFLLYSN